MDGGALQRGCVEDQGPVFGVPGRDHGLTRIRNLTEKGSGERKGKKLLIIKDSYAHTFAPFAVNHFEETLMVDLRYFNADVEPFAREEGVTDVLVLYRAAGFAKEKTVSKLGKGN